MPLSGRYRSLLERIYLDLMNENGLTKPSRASGQAIINVLEFKPFDAAFYNVGVPLPETLPSEIIDRWARNRLVGGRASATFDEESLPLVLTAFQRVHEQVEKVFENFKTMVDRQEWFPGILSPDLVRLVEGWQSWWVQAADRSRRGRVSRQEDRICWKELCNLLFVLIPQPADEGRSAGNVVYAKLTGRHSPAPDLLLDEQAFISPQKSYEWRAGGEADSLSELRSLLELLSVVPAPPAMQKAILSAALASPNRVQVNESMSAMAPRLELTAIGGPMIYHGQLEGIIYAVARSAPLQERQNAVLKSRARLGAARRHQLREHIMRDVLLRDAQGQRDLSPVLLVLKHIALLFSVVGAAAVCLRRSEPRGLLPIGLLWRESTGERQRMSFTAHLGESRDRALSEEIRHYARRLAADTGLRERPTCYGRSDPSTARVLEAFIEQRTLVSRARSVCGFSIQPLQQEEWVYLLYFLEAPSWCADDGTDHLNLETSVSQLQIELEAALDFVLAHGRATEQAVLQMIYTNASHSLKGPVKLARSFVELAASDLREGWLEKAMTQLAKAELALRSLQYSTQVAERFANRMASPSRKAQAQKLDVGRVVAEQLQLFRAIDQAIDLQLSSEGREMRCLGYEDLLQWILWEMLENATRAARKIAETEGAVQCVQLTISYRPRTVSVSIENPAGPLTRADCRVLIKNAKKWQPNRSNTSGGSGRGLAYCLWMTEEMQGRFKIDVSQGFCATTLTLPTETSNG